LQNDPDPETCLEYGDDMCSDDDDMWDIDDCSDQSLKPEERPPRRRLLAVPQTPPTPTGNLDIENKKKFDFTTFPMPGLKYQDRDGRDLRMTNQELKKITYCHKTELGISNLLDRIECPVQPDPNKFQRKDCWAVTNKSRLDVIVKVFELTTEYNPERYVTLEMPMPSYPSQNTFAYIDISTGECVFFHKNGKLWSAKRYDEKGVDKLLNDPNVVKNPKPEINK
jgi:hypothetical protein